MAKNSTPSIAVFEVADLPVRPSSPPKYDSALINEFVAALNSGKAAGDGVSYETQKLARSAANSFKRAIHRVAEGTVLEGRTWQAAEGWMFALVLRPGKGE